MKCIQIQGARGGEGVQFWHSCSPDALQLITLCNLVPVCHRHSHRRHRRCSLTWFNAFDVTAAANAPVHLFSFARPHIAGRNLCGRLHAQGRTWWIDIFSGSSFPVPFGICSEVTGSNCCTNKTHLRFTLFLRGLIILVLSNLRGLVSHATIYLRFLFSRGKIKFYMSLSFIKFFDTSTTIKDFQLSGKCVLERFLVFGLKYVWCSELAYYFSEKLLTAQLPNLQNGWLCPIEYSPCVCWSQKSPKEPIPHLNICSLFSLFFSNKHRVGW